MKKVLAISLAALLALSIMGCSKNEDSSTVDAEGGVEEIVASTIEYEGYEFGYAVNEEGDYEITSIVYDNPESIDVKIPDKIDGRPVTGIGADAFKADAFIKSVEIPDSITYIADFAFYGCSGLTEVKLPASVTSIGQGAFMLCTGLKTIELSSELVTISNYAFMNCTALESITVPEKVKTIGEGAFFSCEAIEEIVIPTSVESVGKGAFLYCHKLASVTINNAKMAFPMTEDGAHIGVFVTCADGLTITAATGSTAEAYATAEEITFVAANASAAQ